MATESDSITGMPHATITRRTAVGATLTALAATLSRAASRLPANKNVKWGLGSNLWNYFKPRASFTDILDVMKDTGFIGLRLTQFPKILQTYNITAPQMAQEAQKRGCQIVTISFSPPSHDPAQRAKILADAKAAMNFLKEFGANHLVVFSPNRRNSAAPRAFETMCECFNEIGAAANAMGFRAGLHNHVGQIVQTPEEVDRCMAMTDPKLFSFSPDTAHLHLGGCDVVKTLEKHKDRLMLADYKDAKRSPGDKPGVFNRESIFDLGDGEIDFPGCHRVLKSIGFKGWLIVDLDIARNGPRASYERCGEYVVKTLDPIYV
jgi:inosose dehydratase